MYYQVSIMFNPELDIERKFDLAHKLLALSQIRTIDIDWYKFFKDYEVDLRVKPYRKKKIIYMKRLLNEYTENELRYNINEVKGVRI